MRSHVAAVIITYSRIRTRNALTADMLRCALFHRTKEPQVAIPSESTYLSKHYL